MTMFFKAGHGERSLGLQTTAENFSSWIFHFFSVPRRRLSVLFHPRNFQLWSLYPNPEFRLPITFPFFTESEAKREKGKRNYSITERNENRVDSRAEEKLFCLLLFAEIRKCFRRSLTNHFWLLHSLISCLSWAQRWKSLNEAFLRVILAPFYRLKERKLFNENQPNYE